MVVAFWVLPWAIEVAEFQIVFWGMVVDVLRIVVSFAVFDSFQGLFSVI